MNEPPKFDGVYVDEIQGDIPVPSFEKLACDWAAARNAYHRRAFWKGFATGILICIGAGAAWKIAGLLLQ